jgi:NlpC/P60 family putative phage cell wall peptidase
MPARKDVIAEARSWIGTPWVASGAAKGVGANCLGFLAGVARNVGLGTLADAFVPYGGFALPPKPADLLRGLRRHLVRAPGAQARPADLLLFDLGDGLRHVAMLTAPQTIIHAYQSKGRVVEHRMIWTAHSAYRIPGLD